MSDQCIVCQKIITDGELIDPEDYVWMCKECVRKVTHAVERSGPGMSLRDYFAAAAVQTIVFDGDYRSFALTAYMIADAMLAERERKPT